MFIDDQRYPDALAVGATRFSFLGVCRFGTATKTSGTLFVTSRGRAVIKMSLFAFGSIFRVQDSKRSHAFSSYQNLATNKFYLLEISSEQGNRASPSPLMIMEARAASSADR